jgi:hypothetical protein
MKRILALLLALCLLSVCVSAAALTAKTVAVAYRTVLDSAKLRDAHSVRFYDVCGDAAPEMILLTQQKNGEQLQIWTWQDGGAVQALAVDWVEVSASKHWFYLLKNGDLAWYYVNGGADDSTWYGTNQGTTYAHDGASLRQTQTVIYNYKETGKTVTPLSGTVNGKKVGGDAAKQADDALRASFSLLLMSTDSGSVPGAMSKSEARTFLNSVTGQFFDVPTGQYYSDAVAWAVATGVTAGTSAKKFSPDSPCTRAQIVTFLYRAASSPAVSPNGSFFDVPTGAYYELPVSWAVENGITTGTAAGKFSPMSTCTRGQIVTFLYRARNITLDPQPVKGWSEVYREFIEEQQFLNAGQEYSFEAGWFLVSVFDMDRDGTPELLIQNGAAGRVNRWSYLYTCVAGKVQYLDVGPAEPYYDPVGPVGIYGRFPMSPEESWSKYTKSGTTITRTDAGTFPLWEGHKELVGLPASRDDTIRTDGWAAFLATQAVG